MFAQFKAAFKMYLESIKFLKDRKVQITVSLLNKVFVMPCFTFPLCCFFLFK